MTAAKPPAAWLPPGDIARALGVDPKTVTRWAEEGIIPPEAVRRTLGRGGGGHRRYSREWLERYLNGGAS